MFRCPKCSNAVAPSANACPACAETVTDFLRRHFEEPLDGKYRILSVLGIGGMGEVYKAQHVHLHATRVIKLMRPAIAGDQGATERFLREARLATRIQHPNVTALYDFSGLPDGSFYMVWEYVDGTNLRRFVQERQFLRPEQAVRLACQALLGLEAIHRAGIVHRDISPENLMVTRDEQGLERIKVIDLGVAKQWNDSGDDQTKTGMFVGKFKYCSPEQLGMLDREERIDGRADIYSFALVLYEMLTGVAPFEAETPHQYLVLHSAHMPEPLRKTNPQAIVPAQLEALVFRALAKDREKRFGTAMEFAQALEESLNVIPSTIAYSSTIVSALPQAQSVAEAAVAEPSPPARSTPPPAPPREVFTPARSVVAPAAGRKGDLLEQVVQSMGAEQFAKADVAMQTLRMHLGVRADTDGEFRRLRKELEAAAADKESWFVAALEGAKQAGKPKELQRLLAEREERLGRRFSDPAVKFEIDLWLRRRDELLVKARSLIAAESFNSAGNVLDELAGHLEQGAAGDDEYLSLRHGFQQALVDSSEKMRQEIVAAHVQENIGKARRLLSMYDARFGQERRKHPAIASAEAWLREMDGMRGPAERKMESTAVRKIRTRRRRLGTVLLFVIVVILAGVATAAWRWKTETADLVRRHTSGSLQATLLLLLDVPVKPEPAPVPAPAATGPPELDPAGRLREGQSWASPIDGMQYVWVPPGGFEMGCVETDALCAANERERRSVHVAGFWLGQTEVTVEAFERFVQQTKYSKVAGRTSPLLDRSVRYTSKEASQPKWPAAMLSADDAAAYCAWAGGRLPTEEEWEYAARARDGRTIHSWSGPAAPALPFANLADESMMKRFGLSRQARGDLFAEYEDGFATYAPVASFPPNRLGIHDLEGNVWEWCTSGDAVMLRGGSWGSTMRDTRISVRKTLARDAATWGTGCRCVVK